LVDDAPNASEPNKNEVVSLKQALGIAHLPGFYLGVQGSEALMLDKFNNHDS
jgi:hypothetical protein